MKIRFSKKGFKELKEKFERLKNDRPAAVLDLKKAREMGDLSENGYYKSARAKLSTIDRDLRYLGHQIKNAYVIEQIQGMEIIGIGSYVELLNNEKEMKIEVVGDTEANPGDGKISLLSPLGRALENKQKGDIVEIKTPSGRIKYQITKIL